MEARCGGVSAFSPPPTLFISLPGSEQLREVSRRARPAFLLTRTWFQRGSRGSGALVYVFCRSLAFLSCALLFSRCSPKGRGRRSRHFCSVKVLLRNIARNLINPSLKMIYDRFTIKEWIHNRRHLNHHHLH